MQGARHIQVGECMLVIMADLNRQIQIVGGGDDIGDKGTRDLVFHHRQCSPNPHQYQISSCVKISQPKVDYLETTL